MQQGVDPGGVFLGDVVHRVELQRRLVRSLRLFQLAQLGQGLAKAILRFLVSPEVLDDESVQLGGLVPLTRDGELHGVLGVLRAGLEVFAGVGFQRGALLWSG